MSVTLLLEVSYKTGMIYISISALLLVWFIKKNWGRFTLGCFMFNDPVDECLDLLLQNGLNSGVKSISVKDEFWITVVFNNGKTMKAWNSNRWYAWIGHGYLGDYAWQDGRPSALTMARLRSAIKRYYLD